MFANSQGPCPLHGYATITAFVRRTQSSITQHVCAASKVYFTIVRMIPMAVNLARTNRAGAVPKKGLLDGVALPPFRVCYRVFCVTGLSRLVKDSLKRATQGIRVKVVGARSLLRQRKGCWIPARTSNRELSY